MNIAHGAWSTAAGAEGATLLVVEDEPVIRDLLVDFLQDHGFVVTAASTADQAVTILSNGLSVDLVFSDVKMPGVDSNPKCDFHALSMACAWGLTSGTALRTSGPGGAPGDR
jgi:CheY-like chemotaxis protein